MNPQPVSNNEKRGLGCGAWFAICSLILIMVGVGAVVVVYCGAKSMINSYTDTAPLTLSPSTASPEDIQRTNSKVGSFGKALENGEMPGPLVLTAEDISNLVASAAGSAGIRATIEDNKLKGELSMPLDQVMPALKGRYLNGRGSFSVVLAEGRLMVFMESLEVRGKPLPEAIMKDLRSKNMAEEVNKDPQFQSRISHIESIRIEDNQMIITPRKP